MRRRRAVGIVVAILVVTGAVTAGVTALREVRLARLRDAIEQDRRFGVVEEGPIRRELRLPTVLEPAGAVAARAAAAGAVASVAAPGTPVRAGEVVARLAAPADLDFRLEQAAARLDLARRALEALEAESGPDGADGGADGGADDRIAAAALEVERAHLALEAAGRDVEALVLRAPWPGRVLSVDAVPGEVLGPGAAVVRLASLDLRVRASLAPEEALALPPGASALGSLQTATGPVFVRLRVEEVGGERPGPRGRVPVTFAVEPSADGALLPGMLLLVNVMHPAGVASVAGTVEAVETRTLAAPGLATVASLPVEPGAVVEAGAVLAELQAPDVRLAREAAGLRLEEAELRLAQVLASDGAAALERRALALEVAEAALALERLERERARLQVASPAGGVVLQVDATPGSRVGPGAPVAWIAPAVVDPDGATRPRLAGTIHVPEAERGAARPGAPVTVALPGPEEDRRPGWIAEIAPFPTAAGYAALVMLDDDRGIPPGARGEVALVAGERDRAVLVPADAVVRTPLGWHVLAYDRARARLWRIWFEPGLSDGFRVEEACGRLVPGTLVLLGGPGGKPLPEEAFRAGAARPGAAAEVQIRGAPGGASPPPAAAPCDERGG